MLTWVPLAIAGLGVVVVILGWSHLRVTRRFRRLLQGADGSNLEALLLRQQDDLAGLRRAVEGVQEGVAELTRRVDACVRRPAVVRYNAFPGTGSDQSFSMALTDASGSGIVLTSLYGREDCRVYAKPVEQGRSTYPLSEEERRVATPAAGG